MLCKSRGFSTLIASYEKWDDMKIELSFEQRECLATAIRNAPFPLSVYNYSNNKLEELASREVHEEYIRKQLTSEDVDEVCDGLSNVLLWGYLRSDTESFRVYDFRRRVNRQQLIRVRNLIQEIKGPSLVPLERVRLPLFTCLSQFTHIRAFLEPATYTVLDPELMTLHETGIATVFSRMQNTTIAIPANLRNEAAYDRWCKICAVLGSALPRSGVTPMDVSLGIVRLVQVHNPDDAARLVRLGEG